MWKLSNIKLPYVCLCLWIGWCLLSIPALGQHNNTTINVPQSAITVQELAKEIHEQTGYHVSYNARVLKGNQKLSLPPGKHSLESLLQKLQQQQIHYTIKGKSIVLKYKAAKPTAKTAKKLKASNIKVAKSKQKPIPNRQQPIISKLKKRNNLSSTSTMIQYKPTAPKNQRDYLSIEYASNNNWWGGRYSAAGKSLINNMMLNAFASSAPHYLYNGGVQLGYKGVFISGQHAHDPYRRRTLFGIGVQVGLAQRHHVQLQYQYGKVHADRSFDVHSTIYEDDSTSTLYTSSHPYSLSAKTHAFSIQYQYSVYQQWFLDLGVSWNIYKTSYGSFPSPAAFINSLPEGALVAPDIFYIVPSNAIQHKTNFNFDAIFHNQSHVNLHLGVMFKLF